MTEVYLIRHSKPLKVNNDYNDDNLQIQNEKCSLSVLGEHIAEEKMSNKEFDNIDVIYSSNYVRAIQTAKYLAEKNNLKINVLSDLGERHFGINSWDELPKNYEKEQLLNDDYKIGNGESQKEVRYRMYVALIKILDENRNKRIAIFSHATAITFLLKKWCNIDLDDDKIKYCYNGEVLLDNYFDYCETFKLVFDDTKKLIRINNIQL